MNQQKAEDKMNQNQTAVKNIEADKERELFGNWQLSDELDDADLKAVAGGSPGVTDR